MLKVWERFGEDFVEFMHVTVSIVTWSSMRTIGEALSSLRDQTYKNMSVLIVDNASTDGTLNYIKKEFSEVRVLRNFKNLGFARAHNQAIEFARHGFAARRDEEGAALVMNPDIVLEPNCVEELLLAMERHKEAGSVGGKLLKIIKVDNPDSGFCDAQKTDILDSTGLRIYKNRRTVDRGAGEKDAGQYDREEEVFGISGALVMYRLSALHTVSARSGFFDERFFAYKEDVDMAWRLRRAGWSSFYAPKAVAYHYRGAQASEKRGLILAIKERAAKSSLVNRLSARNHILTLWKNDFPINVLLHLPYILPYEIGKLAYFALRERKTFFASIGAIKEIPSILLNRFYYRGRVRARAGEIRKWFV